jgi:hypothetical protein
MDFKSILPALGKIAPYLASALAGPYAGSAVSTIENVFGFKPEASATMDARQAAVATAINSADPELLLKLKQADLDYQKTMATLGFADSQAIAALAIQDVSNARAREIAVKDLTPSIIGYVVTAGFFGLLFLLAFRGFPAESKDVLELMIGALSAAWTQSVLSYYYGSSLSGDRKAENSNATIAKMAETASK